MGQLLNELKKSKEKKEEEIKVLQKSIEIIENDTEIEYLFEAAKITRFI